MVMEHLKFTPLTLFSPVIRFCRVCSVRCCTLGGHTRVTTNKRKKGKEKEERRGGGRKKNWDIGRKREEKYRKKGEKREIRRRKNVTERK